MFNEYYYTKKTNTQNYKKYYYTSDQGVSPKSLVQSAFWEGVVKKASVAPVK